MKKQFLSVNFVAENYLMKLKNNLFIRLFSFYYQGFKNMSKWAKTLWLIIFIKLFVMFAVLKIFFFSDKLNSEFSSDQEKSSYVIEQLTTRNK